MTAPAFEALLALQEIDTALRQVRHRRAHLPARAALAEMAVESDRIVERRARARAALDEVVVRQDRLEVELAATEQRAAEVSKRLYSGAVSASRELQALAADVETLGRRASDLEDAILSALDEREPLDAAVAALEGETAGLEQRRDAAARQLAEGETGADAELAELRRRRDEAAEPVPAELITTYERLRERLGGIGVARLVGTHCDGCHLELPATEIDHLRRLPDDELVTCDQCGRILVRP